MARELSNQAAAAKMMRKELKAAFPTIKFQVTSSSFSMGDDVHVNWTDGPTSRQVMAIIGKYQSGHFDGQIDLYEDSNRRDDIPQTKYVITRREVSRDAFAAVVALLNRTRGWSLAVDESKPWNEVTRESDAPMDNGYGYRSYEISRTLDATSLICDGCTANTLSGDRFCPMCGYSIDRDGDLAA